MESGPSGLLPPPGSPEFDAAIEAGKRFRDALAIHQVALTRDEIIAKRYMAVRLIDGSSDMTAYETREDAVTHQLHPDVALYFPIPFERLNELTCAVLLCYARRVYDNGYRPSTMPELFMPKRQERMWESLKQLGEIPLVP